MAPQIDDSIYLSGVKGDPYFGERPKFSPAEE